MADLIDYRFYLLDRAGRIEEASDMRCAGDADAIAAGRRRARAGQAVEVWHRARRVAHIHSDRCALARTVERLRPSTPTLRSADLI